MKTKILCLLLILFSLIGYLEWGENNQSFLFEGEFEVLRNLFTNSKKAIHPFTIIPLIGQILLLIALFQQKPHKILIYLGISGLGLLLGFMFFIGVTGMNFKIVFSTLPFLITAIYTIIVLLKL